MATVAAMTAEGTDDAVEFVAQEGDGAGGAEVAVDRFDADLGGDEVGDFGLWGDRMFGAGPLVKGDPPGFEELALEGIDRGASGADGG